MVEEVQDPIFEEPHFLIRSIALSRGKLAKRRMEIHKSLVTAALDGIQVDSEFSVEQLSERIYKIAKCRMNSDIIVTNLNLLAEESIVQHIEECTYKLIKNITVPEFTEISQSVWEEFEKLLIERLNYDPFIHKNARIVFDSILLKILTRYAISRPLNNEVDFVPIEDMRSLISKEVKKVYFENLFLRKYPGVLLDYFCSNSEELVNCILNCYYWFIDLNLLSEGKKITPVNFEKEIKFLLLDTNFIVTLLCRTDPKYPLSTTIVQFCNRNKIPLCYSQITRDETWNFINYFKSELKLSLNGKNSPPSQFLTDFRKLQFIHHISHNDYITTLNEWEVILKENFKIEMLPAIYEKNLDEHDYEFIKTILPMLYDVRLKEIIRRDPDYDVRIKKDVTFNHDAFCIGIISYLRKHPVAGDEKKLGPWFITYDNLLADINAHFRKDDEIGYLIQPRTLLDYFMVFHGPNFDDKDLENIAIALLRYTVRDSTSIITFDEYIREFTIKLGVAENNADILKEILKRSPLLYQIEEAISQGDIKSADNSAVSALTHPNIHKIISDIKQSNQEKQDLQGRVEELLNVVKKMNEDLIRERAGREALEKIKSQPIFILNFIDVRSDIQDDFGRLINEMWEKNLFSVEEIPKPPERLNASSIKEYVEKIQLIITTTDLIKDGATILLPIIIQILGKIST